MKPPTGSEGRAARARVSVLFATYVNPVVLVCGVFFIYIIPLILLVWVMVATDFFRATPHNGSSPFVITPILQSDSIGMARDVTGLVFVPLLTAFAAPKVDLKTAIPLPTILFFLFLLSVFLVALGCYGASEAPSDLPNWTLDDAGSTTSPTLDVFYSEIAEQYIRESITYIALLLGVSAGKQ